MRKKNFWKKQMVSLCLMGGFLIGNASPLCVAASEGESQETQGGVAFWFLNEEGVFEGIDFAATEADMVLIPSESGVGYQIQENVGQENVSVAYDKEKGILTFNNYSQSYEALDGENNASVVYANIPLEIQILGEVCMENTGCVISTEASLTLSGNEEATATFINKAGYSAIDVMGKESIFINKITDLELIAEGASDWDWDLGMEYDATVDDSVEERIQCVEGGSFAEGVVVPNDGFWSISIAPNGAFMGDENLPPYTRINNIGNMVPANEDNWQLYWNQEEKTLVLKDFCYVIKDLGWSPISIECEDDITIELIGENKIEGGLSQGLIVNGGLTITGTGSLEVVTNAPNEDGYVEPAMIVNGSYFSNESKLTVTAVNQGEDMIPEIGLWNVSFKDIINTGEIYGTMETADFCFTNLLAPVEHYDTSREWAGRVYYITKDEFYPNNAMGELPDGEWWYVGKYEDGKAVPSNVCYQLYYIDENGGWLTDDFCEHPISYLVYEDVETILQDKDVVCIGDGKEHTFNRDLYALMVNEGRVTVNGDVITDLACSETAMLEGDRIFSRDEFGNILRLDNSTNANAIINGNVGSLSLHDSYEGDVTVNGDITLLGFYEDEELPDKYERVPDSYFGSKANAGLIVKDGEFVLKTEKIDGFRGSRVFEDTCYIQTERVVNNKEMVGTVAVVGEETIKVDVSKDGLKEQTYPCVRKPDEKKEKQVRDMLTDKNSKVVIMDISMICMEQDEKGEWKQKEIEPDKEVDLHFEDLSGFKNPAVFHIKDDGTVEKIFVFSEHGQGKEFKGNISCKTSSFSIYFIAEDQELVVAEEDKKEESDKLEEDKKEESDKQDETDKKEETGKQDGTDKKEETGKQDETDKNAENNSPETGDKDMAGVLWSMVIMLGAVAMIFAGKRKRA